MAVKRRSSRNRPIRLWEEQRSTATPWGGSPTERARHSKEIDCDLVVTGEHSDKVVRADFKKGRDKGPRRELPERTTQTVTRSGGSRDRRPAEELPRRTDWDKDQ